MSGSVGILGVEVEVRGDDLHRRLAKAADGTAAGVRANDRTKLRNGHAPGFGHTWYLQLRVHRADVGVESAAAGRDGVCRDPGTVGADPRMGVITPCE